MSRRWSLVSGRGLGGLFRHAARARAARLRRQRHAAPAARVALHVRRSAARGRRRRSAVRASLLVPRSDLLRFAALALTGYGAASVCFFFALKFADASVVAVLLYAYPAFVTLASWLFLGEKATWQRGAAVLRDVRGLRAGRRAARRGGSGAVAGHRARARRGGRLHAVQPAVAPLASRALAARDDDVHLRVASLMAAGLALGVGQSLSPAAWEPSAWWLIAAIVVVPTFAAVVLYLQGIRGLGPSQAAVVSTLEPLFTIALASVFLPDADARARAAVRSGSGTRGRGLGRGLGPVGRAARGRLASADQEREHAVTRDPAHRDHERLRSPRDGDRAARLGTAVAQAHQREPCERRRPRPGDGPQLGSHGDGVGDQPERGRAEQDRAVFARPRGRYTS